MKRLIGIVIVTLALSFTTAGIFAQEDSAVKVYSKFDFIPGEKIVFFDDFNENIGDFPARWNTNGSGEIVTTGIAPGKWFQLTAEGYYFPETKEDFPENFTAEFDFIPTNKNEEDVQMIGFGFYLVSGDMKKPDEGGAIPGRAGVKIDISAFDCSYSTYADAEYKLSGSKEHALTKNVRYHLSLWVQKQRLRLYINEEKIFDVPRAIPEGYKYNILRFEMGGESKPLIANYRVAAGLPDMRNKLITEGKLISYGIYFDVNKANVKPASFATLKEIAQVLKDNPSVKIKIVGHTDSDGDNAGNLELSKQRAQAVKNELVKNFGIEGSRMETDGKGETQPIAGNDNASDKAKNRRVEFIKL